LRPDPGDVAVARRWVADALAGHASQETIETVVLLVSELTTNAVLHAGTDMALLLLVEGPTVHLEVADSNRDKPVVRDPSDDDAHGRGMLLVEVMSDRWGADRTADGKVVWFEISDGDDTGEGEEGEQAELRTAVRTEPPAAPADIEAAWLGDDDLVAVDLLGVPPSLYRRAAEQYELVTQALRHDGDSPIRVPLADRLLALAQRLGVRGGSFTAGPAFAVLQLPAQAGLESVDLHYRVPAGLGDAAAEYDRLLTSAEEECALASAPVPDPAAVAFRRWLLSEFDHQIHGRAPAPWPDGPAGL
jgi:anti-sigma regulatory factor (Ser/Thr protein kinase)